MSYSCPTEFSGYRLLIRDFIKLHLLLLACLGTISLGIHIARCRKYLQTSGPHVGITCILGALYNPLYSPNLHFIFHAIFYLLLHYLYTWILKVWGQGGHIGSVRASPLRCLGFRMFTWIGGVVWSVEG